MHESADHEAETKGGLVRSANRHYGAQLKHIYGDSSLGPQMAVRAQLFGAIMKLVLGSAECTCWSTYSWRGFVSERADGPFGNATLLEDAFIFFSQRYAESRLQISLLPVNPLFKPVHAKEVRYCI